MDNKLKYSFDNNSQMVISDCNVFNLAKRYGTPMYIMNQSIIEKQCLLFSNALKNFYPNHIISYASKAFCCKKIYSIIKKYNFACDVVSGGEILTAKKAKLNPKKIFFHGNNKTKEEINLAIKNNIFNFIVDNFDELETIENIVKNHKKLNNKINIIVRVNPGIEAHTHEYIQTSKTDSKFGINIDSGEAEKFILEVCKKNNLNFSGIHYHIGSQIFDIEPYEKAAEKIMDFILHLKQKHNIEVKLLNSGGGFGVWYTKDDKNLTDKDYQLFLLTTAKIVKEKCKKNNLIEPILVFEPGRSIVAEAGTTLYQVGAIKEIKDIRKYVSVDGGMFENPRYALYQAKYTAVNCKKSGKKEIVTIVGKCCESGDCIIKDATIDKVKKNDLIAVLSTGAYNYSMASNYNRNPIPPVILVNNGKSRIIIKGQKYKDLIKNDR